MELEPTCRNARSRLHLLSQASGVALTFNIEKSGSDDSATFLATVVWGGRKCVGSDGWGSSKVQAKEHACSAALSLLGTGKQVSLASRKQLHRQVNGKGEASGRNHGMPGFVNNTLSDGHNPD